MRGSCRHENQQIAQEALSEAHVLRSESALGIAGFEMIPSSCAGRTLDYNRPMRRTIVKFGMGFRVVAGNRRSQAASMTLPPGECEGGPDNRHRGADQWMFVKSGKGVAVVNGTRHALRAGSLLLIERGERHEIRSTGRAPLRTLNVYIPPAYTTRGDELPRGRK
jgi:mannose-6-phosphate isomerase-like protein (cupin superfamily)